MLKALELHQIAIPGQESHGTIQSRGSSERTIGRPNHTDAVISLQGLENLLNFTLLYALT